MKKMTGAQVMRKANTYGWVEVNSRGVDKALPSTRRCSAGARRRGGGGQHGYTEFLARGEGIVDRMEMNFMAPAQVTYDRTYVRHRCAFRCPG